MFQISLYAQCDFTVSVIDSEEVFCNGNNDGMREIIIVGGIPPYNIQWSNGDSGFKADSLIAGIYYLYVSDSSCLDTITYTITEPSKLDITTTLSNINCGSGQGGILIEAEGGTPSYEYSLDNSDWFAFNNIVNISCDSGYHYLTVIDKKGCPYMDTVEIKYIEDVQLYVDSIKKVTCFGYYDGYIQISITGGTPPFKAIVTEELSDSVFIKEESSRLLEISNLHHGIYRITLTDTNGCFADTSVLVYQPPKQYINLAIDSAEVIFGDVISINANYFSQNSPVNFYWDPSADVIFSDKVSNLIHPKTDTTYVVKLVDQNGCFDYDSVYIDVMLEELYIPNAFTPNNDGINDQFTVVGFLEEISYFSLQIFSRYNLLIAETSDPYSGWDGTYQGETSPAGVYVWKLAYESAKSTVLQGRVTKIGTVTLLR